MSRTRTPRPPGTLRIGAGVGVASLSVLLTGVGATAVSSAASSHLSSSLIVSTLATKDFGTILQSTRTLYTLTPSKVACTATCLTYWPEVLLAKGSSKATAGRGVNGALLGTIKRAGGRLQVTYARKPLYWFALDTGPGQVRGNVSDTWGKWSVVVVKAPRGGNPTTTTTTGGGAGGIGF